jgi:2-polyprenyl-3-methyl-5-hydroxy-6-metoxy-1,4-benzoquinol methylase
MDYIEINKNSWNEKTEVHYKSEFYNVEAFLKGKDTLNNVEIALLGDIEGKKILHLQCHFGLDTISLARRGAQVTGVDFSEKAIDKARELNERLGTHAAFIQCDVYSLHYVLKEEFDIVFTSYGVLGWLPDMTQWARVVQHFLKPGGSLVLVEFHPVVWMFSYDFSRVEYNYMDAAPIIEELEGTYTDKEADIKTKTVSWNHGLATVLNSLVKAGLVLTDINEYNFSPYDCFQNTIKTEDGNYKIKGLEDKIPMLYSVRAERRT